MARELHTEIEIDATPERVWSVLMDFGSYGEWNPFVTSIAGDTSEGGKLQVRLEPPHAGEWRMTDNYGLVP